MDGIEDDGMALIDPIEVYSSELNGINEDKVFEIGIKKLRRKLMLNS